MNTRSVIISGVIQFTTINNTCLMSHWSTNGYIKGNKKCNCNKKFKASTIACCNFEVEMRLSITSLTAVNI